MSHYTRVKTQLKNTAALLQALADLGFGPAKIKHDTTGKQHLEGYEGKLRGQTAEVIIPRKYVQHAANDIGFQKQEDGTYEAIISQFDSNKYGKEWQGKLTQRYAYNNLKAELGDQGFFIESEREEKGEIFLQVGTSFGG